MEEKDWSQILADFSATRQAKPNLTEAEWLQKFPEFGNSHDMLQAAFDYDATVRSGKYTDPTELQSKFPEFWPIRVDVSDVQQAEQTNQPVAETAQIPTVTMEQVESAGHYQPRSGEGLKTPEELEAEVQQRVQQQQQIVQPPTEETPDERMARMHQAGKPDWSGVQQRQYEQMAAEVNARYNIPNELNLENFNNVSQRLDALNKEADRIEQRQSIYIDDDIEPSWVERDQRRMEELNNERDALRAYVTAYGRTDERQDFEQRLGSVLGQIDQENTAQQAWNHAEELTRAEQNVRNEQIWSDYAAMGGGREMRMMATGETYNANASARMKYHDLQRMADEAWNMLGEEKQQAVIGGIYDILKDFYPDADEGALRENAERMARQQSDRRVYELAVENNTPKNAADYFFRKVVGANSVVMMMEALARSSAGTTGDLQAREEAEQNFNHGWNKVAGIGGTVVGLAADPLMWMSGGVGGAAERGFLYGMGKYAGEAATRRFATTLGGRMAVGAVRGGASFGTYEAGKEALNQLRWGGEITGADPESGLYVIGDYNGKQILGSFGHGVLMGGVTGVIAPGLGNVSDNLVRATESTIGKAGIRTGELAVGTVAEGTVFAAPEFINTYLEYSDLISSLSDENSPNYIADENERAQAIDKLLSQRNGSLMDVWTDNMAMVAGFKAQHVIKSVPARIAELQANPNSKAGFETRLRSVLDGNRRDLALTNEEKMELEAKGYNDLESLVSSLDGIRNSTGLVKDGQLPYNRFLELMNDKDISESARAKMYYYLTGNVLPMSTVIGGRVSQIVDDNGNTTGWLVQSFGQNGVITNRMFNSEKAARAEENRIFRQTELNMVEIGERRFDQSRKEGEKTSDDTRRDIFRKYFVDIDKAVKKEPGRRSKMEDEAVKEYLNTLWAEEIREADQARNEAARQQWEAYREEQRRREEVKKLKDASEQLAQDLSNEDDPNVLRDAGRDMRDARRKLAERIGEDKMAMLESMDDEALANAYATADPETQTFIKQWLLNSGTATVDDGISRRSMNVIGGFKENIIKYFNNSIESGEQQRNDIANGIVTVVDINGQPYVVLGVSGSMYTVRDVNGNAKIIGSNQCDNERKVSIDEFVLQQTAPELNRYAALAEAFNGTDFAVGQTVGIMEGDKGRNVVVLAIEGDKVTYTNDFKMGKDGVPDWSQESVHTITRQGLRDLSEQWQVQARREEAAKEVLAETHVMDMKDGDVFLVEWNDKVVTAKIEGVADDGTHIVGVYDTEGNPLETGIDYMTDEQWEALRVNPQAPSQEVEQTSPAPISEGEQQPQEEISGKDGNISPVSPESPVEETPVQPAPVEEKTQLEKDTETIMSRPNGAKLLDNKIKASEKSLADAQQALGDATTAYENAKKANEEGSSASDEEMFDQETKALQEAEDAAREALDNAVAGMQSAQAEVDRWNAVRDAIEGNKSEIPHAPTQEGEETSPNPSLEEGKEQPVEETPVEETPAEETSTEEVVTPPAPLSEGETEQPPMESAGEGTEQPVQQPQGETMPPTETAQEPPVEQPQAETPTMEVPTQPVAPQKPKPTDHWTRARQQIGEPTSAYEAILLDIMNGTKFKWGVPKGGGYKVKDGKRVWVDADRGIGDLWGYKPGERDKRKGMLDDKGFTVETYAEALQQGKMNDAPWFDNMDLSDIRDLVEEALQYTTGAKSAKEQLLEARQKRIEEEQRQIRAIQDAEAKALGFEDWDDYQAYINSLQENIITDEDYNELNRIIAEQIQEEDGQRTGQSEGEGDTADNQLDEQPGVPSEDEGGTGLLQREQPSDQGRLEQPEPTATGEQGNTPDGTPQEPSGAAEVRGEIDKLKAKRADIIRQRDDIQQRYEKANGLFGDTQADESDLFGGQNFLSPELAQATIDGYNRKIKQIDEEIKRLESSLERANEVKQTEIGTPAMESPENRTEQEEQKPTETREELDKRLMEERRQRILAEGTSFDKPFGLVPVSETMTAEDIEANVGRIVQGLKDNEGSGNLDQFYGYAYQGAFGVNAGEQVKYYIDSLYGVVPMETLKAWYDSIGLKTYGDLVKYGKELYDNTQKTEQNPVPQPEPKEEKQPTKLASKKIEDVGEKIEGARKDLARKLSGKIDLEAETFPKMFPKFDLKKLVGQGLDPKLASAVMFLRQAAYSDYKRDLKHRRKEHALGGSRFMAAYAKHILENADTDVEFTDNRWVFTDYGKIFVKTNIALYEKIHEKMGDDMFDVDLSDYKIDPINTDGKLNYTAFRRNENGEEERFTPYYQARAKSGTFYFKEDELDKAIDLVLGKIERGVSYEKSHPFKLNVYYTRGTSNQFYVGVKIGGEVEKLTENFSTSNEALAYLNEHNAELQEKSARLSEQRKEEKKQEKPVAKVEIIQADKSKGYSGGYVFAVKLGKEYVRIMEDVYALPAIYRYEKEHRDELQQMAQQKLDQYLEDVEKGKGWKPQLNLGGGRTRVGEDYRQGRDVSGDEFREAFGFRGVQFGNYVTQKERQRFLNEAYDALMDLADLIGVSPKALSLGGQLGFAIGARGGGGSNAAHYEPGENVINLTKTQGAGSLAHEWWHALDYFMNRRGDTRRMAATSVEMPNDFSEGMREEMRNAFLGLMNAINNSDYLKRSKALERRLHPSTPSSMTGYYDKPTELGARAFQDYVSRRLTERGQVNDFLSSFTPEEQWNGEAKTYPYPTGEDATAIDEMIDKLFGTIEEKQDEQGNAVLYHKVGEEVGLTKEEIELRDHIVGFMKEFLGEDSVITDSEEAQRVLDEANGKIREQRVYHGTGADFDRFDFNHMGEGEGAQAYGWGGYVTEVEGIGKKYAESIGGTDEQIERSINVIQSQMFRDELHLKNAKNDMERRYYEDAIEVAKMRIEELRHARKLYTVEIPNDSGSNYLEWDKPVTDKQAERIKQALLSNDKFQQHSKEQYDYMKSMLGDTQEIPPFEEWTDEHAGVIAMSAKESGERVYRNISNAIGGDKQASEFLHNMGYVGIKYPAEYRTGGRKDKASNYTIFNEGDMKITDKVKFFRTPSGEAYGFTVGGKVYIDPRIATAETPIHEYAHLYGEAIRRANPEAWEHLKQDLLGHKDVLDYVKGLYPKLEGDELMDEVWAHFSGKRGAEYMRSEQKRMMDEAEGFEGVSRVAAIFDRIRKALKKFWNMARDLFAGKNEKLKDMKAEDFADMMMNDFANKFDPRTVKGKDGAKPQSDEVKYSMIGRQGAQRLDIKERAMTRLNNLHTAREMEQQGKDAKAIRLATGWERGKDGKWRFEISDGSLKDGIDSTTTGLTLGDIWEQPELFTAYPKMKDLKVKVVKKPLKAYASTIINTYEETSEGKKAVSAAKQFLKDFPDLNDYEKYLKGKISKYTSELDKTDANDAERITTLQDIIESFEQDLKNSEYRYNKFKDVLDKANTIDETSIELNSAWIPNPDATIYGDTELGVSGDKYTVNSILSHEIQHYIQVLEGFAQGTNIADAKAQTLYKQQQVEKISKQIEELEKQLPKLNEPWTDEHDKIMEQIEKLRDEQINIRYNMDVSREAYRSAAGEVEARNVQKRLGLTPEQRREQLLAETEDVSREDQIVLQGQLGIANADVKAPDTDTTEMSDEEAEQYDAGRMTFTEIATEGVIKAAEKNKEDLRMRNEAVKAIGVSLNRLRQAMAKQKEYDKATVDSIVRLARMMIENGYMDNMSRSEVKRLMTLAKNATGKTDITKQANAVVDLMLKHQLKAAEAVQQKLLATKGSKVNASGVEVQAGLDITGQRTLKAMKEGIELDEAALDERIADVNDRMGGTDKTLAANAAEEYEGLMMAKDYHDMIRQSEQDEAQLRHELDQAKEDVKNGTLGRKDYKELAARIDAALRKNMAERVTAFTRLNQQLAEVINGSKGRAREFREKQMERVREIQHNANSDMKGTPASEHKKAARINKVVNSGVVRFLFKPVATFDEMLRFFGKKSVDGMGYLWQRFMGGYIDAADTEWRSLKKDHDALDEKVSEVMGEKMRWSDLFSMERKMEPIEVEFYDTTTNEDGEAVRVKEKHPLTQGNALYIYMVNKMDDGAMKLRRMGISDEDVDRIAGQLDPRFLQLADWIQDEFLPKKREAFNAVHMRMFGAPMAAIEEYFPLVINSRSRGQEEDINDTGEGDLKISTITGSIIKRTVNTTPLDVTNADAFDVLLGHLRDMEHWAAFAEFIRDANTLISYKHFRNQVLNMSSVRFGAGKVLWKNFKKTCSIAAGVYRPKADEDSIDNAIVNISKGVTSAKISFRLYTALKQLLSYPAYFSEANPIELAKSTGRPANSFNWALDNLPGFAERWQSRQAGDSRLKDTDADWDFWKNKFVDTARRWGMTPNAFVDGITVAMGAKAIYESKMKGYLKAGYSEAEAKEKALKEASAAVNETQQSSQNAYLSAMQLDRTVASVALTVFRNASMGYERRMLRAVDNIKRKFTKGYKEESIEFMRKKMVREGLTEEQAKAASERAWNISIAKDVANLVIFGFVMQLAWNLGSSLMYLVFGGDDDEKGKMWDDAAMHALAGPVEGLSGGSVISEVYNMARSGKKISNYNFQLLPIMSDLQTTMKHMEQDKVRGMQDIVNLVIQAGVGVNPQTITDAAVAIVDAADGDLGVGKEIGMLLLRIAQVPQSQLDQLYIDELGMSAKDAKSLPMEELAQRYAAYKRMKDAPLTGWAYSDEAREKVDKRYLNKFVKLVQERIANMDDEQLEWMMDGDDMSMKRYIGKEVADRLEGKDTYGSNPQSNWKEETKRAHLTYQRLRGYVDLCEDVVLQKAQADADKAYEAALEAGELSTAYQQQARAKGIEKARQQLNKMRHSLGLNNGLYDEQVMENIRRTRRAYMEAYGLVGKKE